MITPLIDTIKKYIRLTKHDIAEIEARSKLKTFSKGDFLLQAGEVAKEMCFVLSGVFRVYAPDPNGREITHMFIKEDELFTETNSYYEGDPSTFNVKAETTVEVVLFSKSSWEELRQSVKDWDFAMKRISQYQLTQNLCFQRLLIDQDATTTYKALLETDPTIALRVPAHHLASYMGITKHSLSRIRKKIASERKS